MLCALMGGDQRNTQDEHHTILKGIELSWNWVSGGLGGIRLYIIARQLHVQTKYE